jgi:two-component system, NtrC family, response regulator AtoC
MRKVLIVDDDPSITRTMELYFQSRNCEVAAFQNGRDAYAYWEEEEPDLILLDVQLPDIDGPDVLAMAKAASLAGEAIMITAFHDVQAALKAIRLGAADYLYKPIDLNALDLLIEKLISKRRERESLTKFSHAISDSYQSEEIIGRSSGILDVIKAIAQVSPVATNVLIEGETGTGKELVAKTIHQQSIPDEPFIAINCAAIVENLIESELFGHEKGAFTGANHRKIGKLEHAGRGIVFLDEISEFPLGLQAKLLRVIQEREFQRVGDVRTLPFRARIIAATNKDLEFRVKEGLFREDLYFRLKVFFIRIPPLRERVEDIVPLTEYFLTVLNQEMQRNVKLVPDKYMRALQAYDWPGNVRELQNVLRRGMILSRGEILELDENWLRCRELPSRERVSEPVVMERPVLWSLAEVEKDHIKRVLQHTGWNLGEACGILGISRPTLRKKISDFGLALNKSGHGSN